MLINNIEISTFGAKVETKMFDHTKDEDTGKGVLFIRLLFQGETRDLVHKNISNFMALSLENSIIKFKNLSNNFDCTYLSHTIEETEFDEFLFVDIEFEGFEFGNEIKETFTTQKSINVSGNIETNAIVSITSRTDLIDCILKGVTEEEIKIKNIKANKTLIIDGVSGLITEEGKNKFSDVELWEFPLLSPGANEISVNRENLTIEIKYTPKWR